MSSSHAPGHVPFRSSVTSHQLPPPTTLLIDLYQGGLYDTLRYILVALMKSSPSPPISDIQSIAQSPLVRRLLDGNLAPSDEERTLLTACRKSSRVRLASIEETIEDMKAQLAVMTEDASQLSQDLEVLDSILHPVRSLPHEIIHHICQLAMEDLQSPSLEALASPDIIDSLSMRHPSWICGQVCHRWRHVIWNNPRCWTNVVVTFHKPVTALKSSLLLVDVIARTRGLPLSVALHSHSHKPIPFLAMPTILQSCSRWRHATLCLTMKDFRLLSEMKHAFGELRTLQLDLHEPPQSLEQPIDAFSEARGVHSLEIVRDVTPYFDLGWHRIQRFTHQGKHHALSVEAAKRILTRTSSIAVADFNVAHYLISVLGALTNTVNVIVPSVRILTLREYPAENPNHRGSGIASFLRTVELPNLTSLSIDMQTVSPLGDLRRASSPSLLNLSLLVGTYETQDSEALGKFLAYAPSVQHFALHVKGDVDLEWVFATDAFVELPIRSMSFTTGGYMTILQTYGSSLAGDIFSSLWRKGAFKTLSIHGISRVSDEVMTTLRGLVEEGLVLDMRDVNGASWRLNGGEADPSYS